MGKVKGDPRFPQGMESWGDGETSVEQGQGGGKRDQKLVIEC